MAPIWQQSYTFTTPVIKSGPLSVQKSLYAQQISCKWTKEIQCDACLQLIHFLLLNAHTILQMFKRRGQFHAMLHKALRPTSMYLCCGELPFHVGTLLHFIRFLPGRDFQYNICSQNACVCLYIDPHLMLTVYKHVMFPNIYTTLISHVATFFAKERAAITYGVAHVSRHETVTWL